MDLKSLSLFMQTSMVYECKVCKLYFGNENQLLVHHKGSHSKRLKVSIDPELKLVEDPAYNLVYLDEETSLQNSTNSENTLDAGSKGNDVGESNVAKLQVKRNSSTSEESDGSSDHSTGVKHLKQPIQSQKQISIDNQDSSSNSCELNENESNNDEPTLKRSKTETEDSMSQTVGTINKNIQDLSSFDKSAKATTSQQHHEHSQSMKDTIEQGHYGYLTETGFHRFSLENLKKFAVQVVALFKLDESHQNLPSCTASSQRMPIPVIQNDVTTSSMLTTFQHHDVPGGSNSGLDNMPEMYCRGQIPVDGANVTGNFADDPNKSCYKCGEQGHFAWGCANPRNREIQPKRKRRGRMKRKEQVEMSGN